MNILHSPSLQKSTKYTLVKSGVYLANCKDCDQMYVRQTRQCITIKYDRIQKCVFFNAILKKKHKICIKNLKIKNNTTSRGKTNILSHKKVYALPSTKNIYLLCSSDKVQSKYVK